MYMCYIQLVNKLCTFRNYSAHDNAAYRESDIVKCLQLVQFTTAIPAIQ